jgi:hypothetical protein
LGLQALLDCLLVCYFSVFQAKGHDLVAIDVVRRYEPGSNRYTSLIHQFSLVQEPGLRAKPGVDIL